jgi:hypothetical protein
MLNKKNKKELIYEKKVTSSQNFIKCGLDLFVREKRVPRYFFKRGIFPIF